MVTDITYPKCERCGEELNEKTVSPIEEWCLTCYEAKMDDSWWDEFDKYIPY